MSSSHYAATLAAASVQSKLFHCRSPEFLAAKTKTGDPDCFCKADSWSFGTLVLQVSIRHTVSVKMPPLETKPFPAERS
jgi:hypothetical protein